MACLIYRELGFWALTVGGYLAELEQPLDDNARRFVNSGLGRRGWRGVSAVHALLSLAGPPPRLNPTSLSGVELVRSTAPEGILEKISRNAQLSPQDIPWPCTLTIRQTLGHGMF